MSTATNAGELKTEQMRAGSTFTQDHAMESPQDWRHDPLRRFIHFALGAGSVSGLVDGLLGYLIGRGH